MVKQSFGLDDWFYRAASLGKWYLKEERQDSKGGSCSSFFLLVFPHGTVVTSASSSLYFVSKIRKGRNVDFLGCLNKRNIFIGEANDLFLKRVLNSGVLREM